MHELESSPDTLAQVNCLKRRIFSAGLLLISAGLTSCCLAEGKHHRRLTSSVSVHECLPHLGPKDLTVYCFEQRPERPAILLAHEIGGPTSETLELAHRLAAEGYSVYVPRLFGEPNRRRQLFLVRCLSRDFACLADNPGRAARRLLALSFEMARFHRGRPLGAIGMCLTGNLPLVLLQNEAVEAAVLSQPTLPLFRSRSLGLEGYDLDQARARNVPILYLRFSEDCLSPQARLDAMEVSFQGLVEPHVFRSSTSEHHAVLTDSLLETREAWEVLTEYLRRRLTDR